MGSGSATIASELGAEYGAHWLRRHNVRHARADAYYPGVPTIHEEVEPSGCSLRSRVSTRDDFSALSGVVAGHDRLCERKITKVPGVNATGTLSAITGDSAIGDAGGAVFTTTDIDAPAQRRAIAGNGAVY